MEKTKLIFIFILFFLSLNASSQFIKEKKEFEENYIESELKIAKSNVSREYILTEKQNILKDKNLAIKVAEPILFSIYGEQKIKNERPYNIFLKENFWIITGTLHTTKGGTFLIIIDARNSKVLRVIHGK
jgi:hypothetical protein